MGIYMSGPLSRRSPLTSLYLFPCKIHSLRCLAKLAHADIFNPARAQRADGRLAIGVLLVLR